MPLSRNFFILVFVIILVGSAGVSAQNQKIGFVDSEFILSRMPEYAGLEQRLRAVTEGWREEIAVFENEIKQLESDFAAREILFTEEVRQLRLNEIQAKKTAMTQFVNSKFGPEGEYFRQQQQLLEPLQRRILEAIERVSNRENYDFVFDRSGDYLFLFTRSQWNISNDVLIEMGIQLNP
jgi:outer membrane protein